MVLGVVSVRCARREAASSPALAARAWRQRSACGAVAREDLGGAGVSAVVPAELVAGPEVEPHLIELQHEAAVLELVDGARLLSRHGSRKKRLFSLLGAPHRTICIPRERAAPCVGVIAPWAGGCALSHRPLATSRDVRHDALGRPPLRPQRPALG